MSSAISRPTVKVCRCCWREYSRPAWEDLLEVGTQPDEVDALGQEWALELRNCPCGSTLAMRIPVQR